MLDHLARTRSNIVAVGTSLRPPDPHVSDLRSRYFVLERTEKYDAAVILFARGRDCNSETLGTLFQEEREHPSVLCISSIPHEENLSHNGAVVSMDRFVLLCERATGLLVGAHDEETKAFWTRDLGTGPAQ